MARPFNWMTATLFLARSVLVATLFGCVAGSAAAASKKVALPLAESAEGLRDFSIEIERVTWLSVDLSPDDEELVLEVLGDLYRLPVGGGDAEPIEVGMAFDSQPAFSPDGEWIAFLSDRDGAENLWIRPWDGGGEGASEPRQLSKDKAASFASPTWSTDGQYVLVSRVGQGIRTNEIWMYHKDGGSGVQITEAKPKPDTPGNQQHNALGVVASPDGRYLYYARRDGGFEYNADFPMWQIARRDLSSGDEDVITTAQGSAVRPRLSPDGKLMVYATRRDNDTGLKVRDLGSGEERWLAYPVQRDEQESRFTRDLYPGYAFTSDGREIVVSWSGRLHRVDVFSGRSVEIPFRVSVDKKIGPSLLIQKDLDDGPVRARITQGAALSPDGSKVAFSALNRLYVKELGSGVVAQVSPQGLPSFLPTWSPDSQQIAFVSWQRSGGHIHRVAATGGTPTRLTRVGAYYTQPAWSPDGARIAALRGGRQARLEMPGEFGRNPLPLDLISVDPRQENADPVLIAPSRGVGKAHFGPEPDRVYVYSREGLISMRFDGSDRRTHLIVKGPGNYAAAEPVAASEVRIGPDGRWALASVSNRFYLLALPKTGAAPTVDIQKPSVPVKKLTALGADHFAWSADGEQITWALGSTFFRLDRSAVSFDKPAEEPDSDDGPNGDDAGGEDADGDDAEASEEPEAFPEATEIALDVELARSTPRGVIALTGARIVPMAGSSAVIENGVVIVRNDRIVTVGTSGEVEIPEGAEIRDVSGKTILPGFVDTHAHWTEIRRGVLDTGGWMFLANLAWGVTTGLDVQTGTPDTFAYQDLIDAGEMIGPRAFSTGPGVFSNNDFQSKAEVKGILERYRDHYRTHNIKAYIAGNRKQRHLIAQAARELGMAPTTEGSLDLELNLTHAIDGFAGNEHSLPVTPLFEDVVELFARSGIGYTPTLLVAYGGPWAENDFYTSTEVHDRAKLRRFIPHEIVDQKTRKRPWFRKGEHIYPRLAAEAAKIVRAGGLVGVGSHGQLQGLGYHWELWALGSGGLTPIEALRCATLGGAEIIGRAQDLGSLEAGKKADLLVLEKNPLDDLRNTDSLLYVMKNGELFEAETLDLVWPRQQPLAPLWWWGAEPKGEPGQAPASRLPASQ